MRPEKLIICGWGPYKEETVIEFEKLNTAGLFLVTGQTGAGKTTIFDAIAYALYGTMSGGMREKGTVRSDFADADTRTYVELYMQHKKQRYHISRNPEYLRPKKRKSGENAYTKEKENAVLTMPDGTIIAGNQDVTDKVKELLQMDGKQFCQISMIAQGEFSRMLFADSKEKNAIFRELFGTGIYERIQGELRRRSLVLYEEYKQYKSRMEEELSTVATLFAKGSDTAQLQCESFQADELFFRKDEWLEMVSLENPDFKKIEEHLKKFLKEKQKEVTGMQEKEEKLQVQLLELQKQKEAAHQVNIRFRELDKAIGRVSELEEKVPWADELKEKIEYAQKVHVLTMEEKILETKQKNLTEMSAQNAMLMNELTECDKQAEILKKTVLKKNEIQAAYEFALQLEEAVQNKKKTETSLQKIQKNLQTARAEYERVQTLAEEKVGLYEQKDARYKRAVIGIAARMVKEGEPCPVCGSLTHPQIAPVSDDIPDEKQLEELKKQAEAACEKEKHLYEQALIFINEEKQGIQSLQEINDEISALEQKLQHLEEEIRVYVRTKDKCIFEQECTRYLELDTLIKEKGKQIESNRELLLEKQKQLDCENASFEQKMKENGFQTRKDYEKASLLAEQLEPMQRELERYQKEFVAAKEVVSHLTQALKGLTPMDEELLEEQFAQKQCEHGMCRVQLEEARLLHGQLSHSLDSIRTNGEKVEKIREEYGIVKDLDDLANGNNARRLVFEQFVLAGYFEKILQAANLRLEKMTGGRYELLRARQVSDGRKKDNLEIMVMDYYTGKQRSVKTLSGGETFKASLALALGMSDCIQAENGGMEVETLFIDEGFGALDEESLEQACDTLMMLAGKNRMVGIISHVAQLRERIEHQIIVEKKNNGSSARVV